MNWTVFGQLVLNQSQVMKNAIIYNMNPVLESLKSMQWPTFYIGKLY